MFSRVKNGIYLLMKDGERKKGQVMIETAILAAMLVAAVAVFAVFLYTFKQDSGRTVELVAYEYP